MIRPPQILLDDARNGRLGLFEGPYGTVTAWEPEEVPAALQALNRAVADGFHAAGYFAYELGYALEPRLKRLLPKRRGIPLLWFGLFRGMRELSGADGEAWLGAQTTGRAYAGPLRPAMDAQAYGARFRRLQDYIAAGDVYQVNLTFPARFAFAGDPLALYRRLRMQAGGAHCAYVFDGERSVLSLSPELFFSLRNGVVTSRPMKGTAPRGDDDTSDARLKAALAASVKDRAENLMIVDLIRNDLGRVAKTGSVRVGELFAVETYPTVHQMVSTVSADLRPGTAPSDLIAAMFPCGSITGAPKIHAMEIVRELEIAPRGVYCGAIGRFSPDGSADFNVAIRTLTISGGTGELGVGGGVVADSVEADEYEECLIKARYYTVAREPLSLIETLRFEPQRGFLRGRAHLDRLARSAKYFGMAFDVKGARRAMADAVKRRSIPARIRLELNEKGKLDIAVQNIPSASTQPWTYAISDLRVQSGDALARHKTSWRTHLDGEFARLHARTGCDQVLFLNERGEIAEGNYTNVFIRLGKRLLTPPLSSGGLDGVFRREMLRTGACAEAVLYPSDLARGAVYFGNSLRGLIPAIPVGKPG